MRGIQTTIGRRGKALAAAAGIALAAAAAAPAGAAAAPLAFAPCADRAQAGWECATLVAPLDHTGATPGQVELRVQRLAHDGPTRPKALVNIEGGPGISTTGRSAQTKRLLAEPAARNGYELILLDTRATGASKPQTIELGTSGFYSTADTVKDLEQLRSGLGIEKLAIMGTSYSTLTAAEYARAHPAQTDRLILDSPVGPDGPDLFAERAFAAVLPAVTDVCRLSSCPVRASAISKRVDALLRFLRRKGDKGIWFPSTYVDVRDGRPVFERAETGYIAGTLVMAFILADERAARYAQLPAALDAAARGDWRLLGRDHFGRDPQDSLPWFNADVNRATRCLDTRVPWPLDMEAQQRQDLTLRLMRALPDSVTRPWGTVPMELRGPIWQCLRFGPSGQPGAIRGGPIPDVPGVILQGAWDLRMPPADGRALADVWPSGTLVMAPGTGHGVLRSATECAREAVDQLLAGSAVDADVCKDLGPVAQPLQVATAADVRPLRGAPRAVARTASAVVATLRDAEVTVAVSVPSGGSTIQAGLRAGWVRGKRTPPSPAVRAELRDYALLEGLKLTGAFAARGATSWTAKVKLSGRHRGAVKIAGGRLTGTIDGRRVAVRLPATLAKPGVLRFG